MRIGERGQITIPKALRERYDLLPGSEVEFIERDGELILTRNPKARRQKMDDLYGRVQTGLSTDEIMAFLRD
ncbi:MAG: AbrB/MazE/SpoVT family DNA-binding domain-containing protein [Magnetococcales bacterium]|nr:AbrB/MazE/SpoVT family DNA-binding domain-containing protein [Magnetococcales bacterium]